MHTFIKKNWLSLVLIAVVAFLALSWPQPTPDGTKELQNQKKAIEEQLKKEAKARQQEKDSLLLVIEHRNIEITEHKSTIQDIKKRIQEVQDTEITLPETNTEIVQFYDDRYSTENKDYEEYIGLTVPTSLSVIHELKLKDKYEIILPQKDSIIVLQDDINSKLEENIEDISQMLSSAESKIKTMYELQDISDQNIQNLQKQLKIQKRKMILIPIAAAVGILVGSQLK